MFCKHLLGFHVIFLFLFLTYTISQFIYLTQLIQIAYLTVLPEQYCVELNIVYLRNTFHTPLIIIDLHVVITCYSR